MTEKRYLKWYNKIGYGSGDIAGNVVYAFLTFFVMIYLTDTIGLNPGIIGTLMAVAKIFDGISDVIFGSLIDKTHPLLLSILDRVTGTAGFAVENRDESGGMVDKPLIPILIDIR